MKLSSPDQAIHDPEWSSDLESIFNYALLDGDIDESDDKTKDQEYQVDMDPSASSIQPTISKSFYQNVYTEKDHPDNK